MAKETTDGKFEADVLRAKLPVLVDFWASWCGPCRQLLPVIDEISEEMKGRVEVVKCNVDDNPITPGKYGIKSIPTLIFFKEGNVVDKVIGMVAKSRLEGNYRTFYQAF